ncbi:2-keto-3-deoxy-L-rhamnonate aldolase [Ricinus communis]|uniref:2-keto-3-deoxy-L-rhamnonate aldolase n=1 Tax=Ricinus communis TaxID=3988 RepID=UPI00201B251B|nr:2-keto-3-deoxy-L-rhamnonate aldolase [Ricinus communis]
MPALTAAATFFSLSSNHQNPNKPQCSSLPNLPFNFKTLNPNTIITTTTFKTLTPLKSSTSSDVDPTSSSTTPISAASSFSLKSRLRNGETLYGIFLLSFSPTLAEISGLAGYDFAVVDMEHGPGGITEALNCLRALASTQTPAIIRLPETCPTWAKKALDLGPQGIMFPMVESPKMAKKAVSYCRFPPEGIRGSAHTVVRASSYGIDEGYLSNYGDELLIMCQVESEEGVKKADEIAAVDGVDCIQMGPLDLSASMGYLWDPGHKKVREMMRAAEKAVLGSKKGGGGAYLAGFSMPHDGPIDLKSRGYNMVAGTVDVGLFRSAAVDDVKKFKMSLVQGSDDEEEHDKDADEKYWSE